MVGIGPGDLDQLTYQARSVLEEVEVIIGYRPYLDLIAPLIVRQTLIASGMTQEVERCQQAVALARAGKSVAVVSSGDPGVYGMAGLVLELLGTNPDIPVEIVGGLTAAQAAAACLGAPLMNDFAVLSLSDRLNPWERIIKKVELAALADLVLVLYNPKSKTRVRQIDEVQQVLLRHRAPVTPVGIVRNAKRGESQVTLTNLAEFTTEPIDMFCTVIIGNSQTRVLGKWLVTPRGYAL